MECVPPAVRTAFARRVAPGPALADDAEKVARACHDMALRFHRGGKLIVFGSGGPSTDVQRHHDGRVRNVCRVRT